MLLLLMIDDCRKKENMALRVVLRDITNLGILTKVHRQYYLRDPVIYNSTVVKTIFYGKIGIKCRLSWVFLCFLLTDSVPHTL